MDRSVTIVTNYRLETRVTELDSRQSEDSCLLSTVRITSQEHTCHALQLVPEAISPEINWTDTKPSRFLTSI
jgi:hypothetical protein